jgi:alpha-galactosidase
MLLAGHPGGLNEVEQRTQFSMWAIMASPLFLGNDVFRMPAFARATLMNKEVIAVDQDALGIQGDVVETDGNLEVWSKKLHDGSIAVALLNRDDAPHLITAHGRDLGISGKFQVRDLWEHADKGRFADAYAAQVAGHAAVVLRITPLTAPVRAPTR